MRRGLPVGSGAFAAAFNLAHAEALALALGWDVWDDWDADSSSPAPYSKSSSSSVVEDDDPPAFVLFVFLFSAVALAEADVAKEFSPNLFVRPATSRVSMTQSGFSSLATNSPSSEYARIGAISVSPDVTAKPPPANDTT